MSEDIGATIARTAATVSAPPDLRRRIERSRPPRARLAATAVVLGTVAMLAAILVPSGPSIEQVAGAALNAPTRSAPATQAYAGGYRAVGARTDRVGGRRAVTVIYRRGAAGVHYTVVDGEPLELPEARRVRAGDLRLALTRYGDVNVVAWQAGGRTCVLASRAEGLDALVRFAGTSRA